MIEDIDINKLTDYGPLRRLSSTIRKMQPMNASLDAGLSVHGFKAFSFAPRKAHNLLSVNREMTRKDPMYGCLD